MHTLREILCKQYFKNVFLRKKTLFKTKSRLIFIKVFLVFCLSRSGFKTAVQNGRSARRRPTFSAHLVPCCPLLACPHLDRSSQQWITPSHSIPAIRHVGAWLVWPEWRAWPEWPARCHRWLVDRHCPCRHLCLDRASRSPSRPPSPWAASANQQAPWLDWPMGWIPPPRARPCMVQVTGVLPLPASPRPRMPPQGAPVLPLRCHAVCKMWATPGGVPASRPWDAKPSSTQSQWPDLDRLCSLII